MVAGRPEPTSTDWGIREPVTRTFSAGRGESDTVAGAVVARLAQAAGMNARAPRNDQRKLCARPLITLWFYRRTSRPARNAAAIASTAARAPARPPAPCLGSGDSTLPLPLPLGS